LLLAPLPKQRFRPVPIGPTGRHLMTKVERGQGAEARATQHRPATWS
jgi:hypothetical protein